MFAGLGVAESMEGIASQLASFYAAAACAASTLASPWPVVTGLATLLPLSCAGPFGCTRNRFRMFRPLPNHPFPDDPLAAEAVSLPSTDCSANRGRLVR